jgi:hypothetical protein
MIWYLDCASGPERLADEFVDLLEIGRAVGRAGEYHRKRQVLVRRIEQNTEKIQNFFGRPGASGEYDDAMAQPDEGLEALFDVRHDDQLAHDGIGRLRRDDAGLGDPQVPAVDDALLGMPDGGALHGALHGAGAAARAHVEAAQPELVADFLRVVVFHPRMEWPPQQTTRFGRICGSRARAFLRM